MLCLNKSMNKKKIGIVACALLLALPFFYSIHKEKAFGASPIIFPVNGGTGTSTKPSLGQMLVGNALGGYSFIASSTLGGGTGTVTSVAATVPTGLSISGSPVTTSGTLAFSLQSGYNIPLTASTTNWDSFFQAPSTRITAGTGLTWAGNTLNGANQSITLSGDVSGSGSTAITTTIGSLKVLGSMIANAAVDLTTKVTGILPVANGGSGAGTLTGLLKGNGTSPFTTASAGTDYQAPITLTTTGSSGAATFLSDVLNIPQYSSGGGSPAGSDTQIQYNNGGAFGASSGFTFASTTKILSIPANGYFGIGSLPFAFASTTNNSVTLGLNTGGNLTSAATVFNSVAIGNFALGSTTAGTNNTAVGYRSLNKVTISSGNTGLGYLTLFNNNGGNNTAVGSVALQGAAAGSTFIENTAVGQGALSSTSLTGNSNTALGMLAGSNLTTGSQNIVIGANLNLPQAASSGQINIGNILYGAAATGTGSTIAGRIGIGTTTPAFLLDVYSTGTTTARIDNNSATKGACFVMKDSDGSGYTYITANNGVLTASTIACN